MAVFEFRDYPVFADGEIEVVVRAKVPGYQRRDLVPVYEFDVRLPGRPVAIGGVSLRIGNTEHIVKYAGHIGYGIDSQFRGHRYAARACRLIRPVARDHGFQALWITCNPDNFPSRRTCEILGCEFAEIVDLPPDTAMYRRGERRKCRYLWDIAR